MLARLWWKETRTLWPAWPTLFGAGVLLQWILLASGSEGVRSGVLIPIALCWAAIYAFVAASSAFAGERETGTLDLLDALPVDRRTLWLGKATFVLASTLGLALVMLALGYLGSSDVRNVPGQSRFCAVFGTLLFEAVAWGLLASALLRNPMLAGILALICVTSVSYLAGEGIVATFEGQAVILARLVMGTLALAASAIAIIWRPLSGWSSPRFLNEDGAGMGVEHARAMRPRPVSSTRALMWKAWREGGLLWLGASVAGWVALGCLLHAPRMGDVALPVTIVGCGAALVAGVGVFGGETVMGSQRYLLHLGVSPGRIWSRTVGTWGIGLTVTALGLLVILSVFRPDGWVWFGYRPRFGPGTVIPLALWGIAVADFFVVGMLVGMVFRRRITAGVIAMIVCLAIVPLQLGLTFLGMVPPWALLPTPMALLGISRAWAGDWLDVRPGPARWLRLVGYLAIPSILFPGVYIVHRAWGVPDPGPVVSVGRAPSEAKPSDVDTAAVYRELAREILRRGGIAASKSLPPLEKPGRNNNWLWTGSRDSQDLVDRIVRATEMPPIRVADRPYFGIGPVVAEPAVGDFSQVALLLTEHGRGLLERGQLAGAWRDILAQYRMVGQLTGVAPTNDMATRHAIIMDQQATRLALDWAADSKQTPELLRQALTDLGALAPLPTLGDVLRATAPNMERIFDLSGAELEVTINGSNRPPNLLRSISEALVFYSPWERERARRICRAEIKRQIAASAVESAPSPGPEADHPVERLSLSSPLASMILSNRGLSDVLTQSTAGRRGLIQVIALRAWNLTHEGRYPETLEALVPEFLDRLPLDPYSAQPFVYMRPPKRPLHVLDSSRGRGVVMHPGQRLLLSVGWDRKVGPELDRQGSSDDIVFSLP